MEKEQCCDQIAEIVDFYLILALLLPLPEFGGLLDLVAVLDCAITAVLKWGKQC